jgi:hypothetical protein
VAGNRMHSTIPPSWSHFTSGRITASDYQLYGCLPGGIRVSPTLPRCSNSWKRSTHSQKGAQGAGPCTHPLPRLLLLPWVRCASPHQPLL